MKIGIICPHSFPIPYYNRSGDVCILDLAKGLELLGHEVHMFAPDTTDWHRLYPMRCSYGGYPPTAQECEMECLNKHSTILRSMDIIHDWSTTKSIAKVLFDQGKKTIITHYGGSLSNPNPPHNIVAISNAQKDRLLRGKNDYEGIDENIDKSKALIPKEVHMVYHGIDTGFYCPDKYQKEDFVLWLGRWHPVRGYKLAIELAKKTGIRLIMAGQNPANELFEFQRNCSTEALELAKNCKNIEFYWLPKETKEHMLEKRELLRRAKVVLQPTQFHEPGGLTQLEAISCGTPVIATDYGSMPEMIVPGKTGFLCENTVDSFAEALQYIDQFDPAVCRKYAVGNFDLRIMAKKYLEEYNKVLAGEVW